MAAGSKLMWIENITCIFKGKIFVVIMIQGIFMYKIKWFGNSYNVKEEM